MNEIDEFEIEAADGQRSASNSRVAMTVLPDGEAKLFKRNAFKNVGTPDVRKEQWLVAELDGVRAYISDDGERLKIVMSKQDLYP